MSLKWVPKMVYNAGTVLTFSIAQRLWEPEEGGGIADEDESAAGVPESFVVRYDQACKVTVRFLDSEYVAVLTALEWIMKNKGTAFTYWFDQAVGGSAFSVYLETPTVSDRLRPKRSKDAPWTWELDLVIRSSNGTRLHQPLVIT